VGIPVFFSQEEPEFFGSAWTAARKTFAENSLIFIDNDKNHAILNKLFDFDRFINGRDGI